MTVYRPVCEFHSVLTTDGVSEWELGPPWRTTAVLRIRELAPASPGVVAFRSDDGIGLLDRDGVRACDPGSGASDPCGSAPLGRPIVLPDGTPASGGTDGLHVGSRIFPTEAAVTALATVGPDLVLVGDADGGFTTWSPGKLWPRARIELDAPVVAIAADTTRVVLALADDRVVDVDPLVLSLLVSGTVPLDRHWVGPAP